MDLRGYLSKTNKTYTLDSIKDDELSIFCNWFFQRHQEQGVGNYFINNLYLVIETVEDSVLSSHWHDLYMETGYETNTDTILTEIFDCCKFEIEDAYYTQFTPLDEYYDNIGMTDEECEEYLEAEYNTIAVFDSIDAIEMYIKIFKESNINYIKYNNYILVSHYFYGDDYVLKIKKDDKSEILKEICSAIDTAVDENEEYLYFIYSEDFNGYNYKNFYAATLVNELYKHNLVEIVDKNIINVDGYTSSSNANLFNRFLNQIVETREVIF